MVTPLTLRGLDTADRAAARTAMALPAAVVSAKGHGHAGTAMSLAPLAHVLFSRVLRHDPSDPEWEGRDRLVLSAGHASLLLYTQLFLTGYGLTLDDLARSRQLDSPTPGHPERGHTPGVELTTGPLGQGLASAVGLALAVRRDEARHGRGAGLFDPGVWVVAGDGCLQEGVAAEASSLAGTLGLENLVVVWDDNRITIDGTTDDVFDEDVRARYAAYGWRVLDIGDHLDLDEIEVVLRRAAERDGRPTLVACRSVIAVASPARAGTPAAHAGGFDDDDLADVHEALGFRRDAALADLVPAEVLGHTRRAVDRGRTLHAAWAERLGAWRTAHPDAAAHRDRAPRDPAAVVADVPEREGSATRTQNGAVVAALVDAGALWGGAADVAASAGVAVAGRPVTRDRPGGDVLAFGIREHAMTAILNGIAAHGRWRPYGACYLAFSDYLRPSLRLAALMGLPTVLFLSHDSLAVGEDGPTHQPVEQLPGLRAVPGLDVVRPADAAEVLACWRRVAGIDDHPVAWVLSRQALPALPPAVLGDPARGAAVVGDPAGPAESILVASGSEVAVALAAAELLAGEVAVRVVSVPCLEWFAAEPEDYRAEILPPGVPVTVVEACSPPAWGRVLDGPGAAVGVTGFGESGAGGEVLARAGVTAEHVAAAVRARRTADRRVG